MFMNREAAVWARFVWKPSREARPGARKGSDAMQSRARRSNVVFGACFACVVACGGADEGQQVTMMQPFPVSAPPAATPSGASGAGGAGGSAGASVTGAAGIAGAAGSAATPPTAGSNGAAGSIAGMGGGGGMAGGQGAAGAAGDAGSAAAGTGGAGGENAGGAGGSGGPRLEGNFSFFVTSLEAMRELSGSEHGFGGDFGGLEGADAICQMIAQGEGAGHKTWRAFLSATSGGDGGGPVHAIDRVGEGPWYDRNGRLVAMDKANLAMERPNGDAALRDNLPNERGEPLNRNGADDHDVLTGSNAQGRVQSTSMGDTCNDWTSAVGSTGRPNVGHSWPAFSGRSWMQAHPAGGCAPGVFIVQMGPPMNDTVGGGGGYGAIYCFALEP